VRELEASSDPRAALALDYFVYRVGLSAGMLAAALGGLDAFVFTAGIGENSAMLRARIADKLGWLGAALDPAANTDRQLLISQPKSRVALFVIPTDEELMIVRHTLSLLSRRGAHVGVVYQKQSAPDAESIPSPITVLHREATRRRRQPIRPKSARA
jgi:acetate kinase